MIHMRAFMTAGSQQRLKELLQWGKLRQEQLSQAILITKDSVVDYLKRQLQKGKWREVEDVLEGKPMTNAGKFMFEQLQDHVISNLIMRLGLRKVLAVAIAAIILPLILAKLGGDAVSKFRDLNK
ncbi:hypothetical protein H8S95_05180 [Pontibacter sp. KCTC 32443]|uniref:hypothetical protein n=1 Tax=Pontibacter TaxID=323449 RepID=UPI00164D85C4|nr:MULTISPECIES: hypothetical protein [Pontibacter]MBC5773448.1 hypothetical protein [Pontibacter sp. KCTC 32443]